MNAAHPSPPAPGPGRALPVRLLAALPGVLIVVAVLAWAWLHVPALAAESLWTDELAAVGDATHDLIRMLKTQGADIHPPLHAFVLWVLQRVTHDASEATMRLPSMVAVTVGLAVLGLAAWRRLGPWVALVVMVLGLASPLVGGFAAQARPHPLSFGFVCLATAAWLLLLRPGRPDRRLLVIFSLAGMLAGLSQHYGALAFGLQAAVLVAWLARQARANAKARAEPESRAKPMAEPPAPASDVPTATGWADVRLATMATLLAILPVTVWLAATRQWTHGSGTPPLTWPWAEEVVSWVLQPWAHAALGWNTEEPRSIRVMAAVLGIALLLLAGGLAVHRRGARARATRERLAIGAAALGIALAAASLAVVQSLLGSPSFHNRAILSLLPLIHVGLAVALTAPAGRWAPVASIVLAVALGGSAVGATQVSLYGPLDQWREAAAIVREEQRAGLPADRIAVVELYDRDDWTVSLGNAYRLPAPVETLPPELAGLRWIGSAADIGDIPRGRPMVLVAFHYYRFDVQGAILAATRERLGPCTDRSVRGIAILACAGAAEGP